MTAPLVTIVVVPRERFSYSIPSLESLFQNTDPSVPLIYVDGASPAYVRRHLDNRSREKGFRIIRTRCYLSPNEARNLGFADVESQDVKSKYVAFVDNDVLFTPGWLDAMVACAEETGAWAVCPVYCYEDEIVHTAGGAAGIEEREGRRVIYEHHRFAHEKLGDVRARLSRTPVNTAEFHTVLVRGEVFERLGLMDEEIMSTRDHVDFGLTICAAGETIYFEPESVVAYMRPPPLRWSDIPYYLLRWSEAWNQATFRRVNEKWGLNDDFAELQRTWLQPHRRLALMGLRRWARRLLGARAGDRLVDWLERLIAEHGLRRRRALKRFRSRRNQPAPPPDHGAPV